MKRRSLFAILCAAPLALLRGQAKDGWIDCSRNPDRLDEVALRTQCEAIDGASLKEYKLWSQPGSEEKLQRFGEDMWVRFYKNRGDGTRDIYCYRVEFHPNGRKFRALQIQT